jgi:hypothetical protein
MKTESGLHYGNLPTELGEVLSRHFQQLPAFRSAMVLSIDSTRTPSDILSILARYGIEARLEAAIVLVAPEQLYRAVCAGVFAGFDQVWLLESDRPKQELPLRNYFLSDVLAVEACMKETACVLALDDGFDLSYATWDGVFAAFLESQFQAGTSKGSA